MKKIIKVGTILLIVAGIAYLGIFYIQNYLIKNSIKEYTYSYEYNVKNVKEREALRCNLNIFNPEFAEVELENRNDNKEFAISFWTGKMFFKLNRGNWKEYYVGGVDIKNTTFPQLLKMVKKDCYQFQETFYQGDDNKLWWTYTKYNKRPEKTEEEIKKERLEDIEWQKKVDSGEIEVDTRTLDEILEELKLE